MKKATGILLLFPLFLVLACNNPGSDSERDGPHKNHMDQEHPDTSSMNNSEDAE